MKTINKKPTCHYPAWLDNDKSVIFGLEPNIQKREWNQLNSRSPGQARGWQRNQIRGWQNNKAFTLVELIIVITILAILATIAFVSFQWYTKNTRDSNRVSTINNIEKWLELFYIQTNKYPTPDETTNITWSWWDILIKQWILWETVSRVIKSNKTPIDPLTNNKYTYSTRQNEREYQLATILESDITYNNMLIPTTYANTTQKAHVVWNYIPKIFTTPNGTMYFIPSLILADIENIWSIEIPSTKEAQYFVVHKWNNLPYKLNSNTITTNTTSDNLWITKKLIADLVAKGIDGKTEQDITTAINNAPIANNQSSGFDSAKTVLAQLTSNAPYRAPNIESFPPRAAKITISIEGTMPIKVGDIKPTCKVNIAPPMAEKTPATQKIKIW